MLACAGELPALPMVASRFSLLPPASPVRVPLRMGVPAPLRAGLTPLPTPEPGVSRWCTDGENPRPWATPEPPGVSGEEGPLTAPPASAPKEPNVLLRPGEVRPPGDVPASRNATAHTLS